MHPSIHPSTININSEDPPSTRSCKQRQQIRRQRRTDPMMMMMTMRKGPWTEEEDIQLVLYVNLYGDRRWDFIAKVSGLRRTGKSCRLRWVNYLHPGLKRGKMTPQEEHLVLELHSKWGNRWSRIARKLPGRTDNEIKNYWRTLMRKTAQAQEQEKKSDRSSISTLSSPMISNSSSVSSSMPVGEGDERSFYDTGGLKHVNTVPMSSTKEEGGEETSGDIWKEITSCMNMNETNMFCDGNLSNYHQTIASPILWDKYSSGSLWNNILDTEPIISVCNDSQYHQIFAEYDVNQLASGEDIVSHDQRLAS